MVADADFPLRMVDRVIMPPAQQHQIVYCGFTAVDPVPRVVVVTDPGWSAAARETAPAISRDQGATDTQRDGAHRPADFQGLGVAAHHHWDQCALARDAAGVASADQLSVVQGGATKTSTQRVPVDGHRQVRAFPATGGEIVGGAGALAQLDERIGVALRHGPAVGRPVVGGAPGGELLDQRPDRGTVLGIQPALQAQASMPPVAQLQLSPDRRRRSGIVNGLGVRPGPGWRSGGARSGAAGGVEVPGVPGQVCLDPLTGGFGDRRGQP